VATDANRPTTLHSAWRSLAETPRGNLISGIAVQQYRHTALIVLQGEPFVLRSTTAMQPSEIRVAAKPIAD
jgi:hypothetical protein